MRYLLKGCGSRDAFSMMEMMVVVVLSVLFVIVAVPVILSFKKSGHGHGRSNCASNLHQFDMAVATFMLDSGEVPPAHLTDCPAVASKLFKCPNDPFRKVATTISAIPADAAGFSSYDYWPASFGSNTMNISTGAFTPVMGVCDKNGTNDVTSAANGFGGNHDGKGGNVLFNDHSTRWIQKEQWGTTVWCVTNWAELGQMSSY
ncbi:MAG: hypothetical protein C0404_14390 [Verrucomicrobia bacterium]|nr:hypothetical protein [Verrucomicrobiota bacterium]